jgi:hypothetical protein
VNAREHSKVVAKRHAGSNQIRLATEVSEEVSNVWEPLLKDLLVAYEHAVEHGGKGHRLDDSVLAWGGYTRAKEALSE